MITRLIIASLLTVGTLSGVAVQQAHVRDRVRPDLLFFTNPLCCAPCRWFDADCTNIAAFRRYLASEFDCKPAYRFDSSPDKFREWNVERVPTWIILDARGTEMFRVSGYHGATDLMNRLRAGRQNSARQPISRSREVPDAPPRVTPPRPTQPQPIPPADQQLIERLQAANAALENERDTLAARQSQLQRDMLAAKQQATEQASKLTVQQLQEFRDEQARLQRQIDAVTASESRYRSELENMQQRLTLPSAPYWITPAQLPELSRVNSAPPPADISTEISAPPDIQQTGQATISHVPANPPTSEAATQPTAAPAASPDLVGPISEVGNRWTGVLGTLALGAVKLAAPQFAIPATMAIGGLAWLRKRKAGQADLAKPFPQSRSEAISNDTASQPEPTAAAEEFDVTLPFQDVDYTTAWADHWIREGKSAELAAKEFSHYVNAFNAVSSGELKLPGIDNTDAFVRSIRNWVAKQFKSRTNRQPDANNTNHKAFYAFLHKQAMENIRNGTFNTAAPNPKAADVLEDWVNQRLVGDLVFNPEL